MSKPAPITNGSDGCFWTIVLQAGYQCYIPEKWVYRVSLIAYGVHNPHTVTAVQSPSAKVGKHLSMS
jgi:hypothetical protein